jgi:hypothetical protein
MKRYIKTALFSQSIGVLDTGTAFFLDQKSLPITSPTCFHGDSYDK